MEQTRNRIFEKIQPTVSEAIFKILQRIYPVYVRNNIEDIKSDINLELIKTIDVTCKIFNSQNIYKDEMLSQLMRNNSIDVFIISSTLTAVERKIEKRVKEESINFSLQVIREAFEENHEMQKEVKEDFPILHLHTVIMHNYDEIDDLENSNEMKKFYNRKISRISKNEEVNSFDSILRLLLNINVH